MRRARTSSRLLAGVPGRATALGTAGLLAVVLGCPASAAASWKLPPDGPPIGNGPVNAFPSVGIDGGGDVGVAWSGAALASMSARRDPAGVWTVPEAGAGVGSRPPELAMNADGLEVLALRQNYTAAAAPHYEVVLRRRASGVAEWSSPVFLSSSDGATSAGEVRIAVNASGAAVVVWSEHDDAAPASLAWSIRAVSVDAAGTPEGTELLASTSEPPAYAAAIDPAGAITAAWAAKDPATGVWSAHARRRPAASSWWMPPAKLSPVGTNPRSVSVALGPSGRAVAVWRDDVGAGATSVFAAVRPAGSAIWGKPVALSTGTASPQATDRPQVAIDSADAAVIAWEERDTATSRVWLRAVRHTPAGGWSGPIEVSTADPGSSAQAFDLSAGANGLTVLAWERQTGPGSARVVEATVRRLGIWTTPVTIAPAAAKPSAPRVSAAPLGSPPPLPTGAATAVPVAAVAWSELGQPGCQLPCTVKAAVFR